MLAEHIEDFLNVSALLASGVQFAVGVCTGASLSETVVRFAVYRLLSRYLGYINPAFVHILSSFHDDRLHPKFDEPESREQSAGAGSDDDNLRTALHVAVFRSDEIFILRFFINIYSDLEIDINSTLTCVYASFQHLDMIDAACI